MNTAERIMKIKQPQVTVIIPVYNAECYLKQCIESVIGQTLVNIEIICVDDGSKDASREILEHYSKIDKRTIVLTHITNKGLPASRNTGIEAATGEYLYFLDSDDYLERMDALEILYNAGIEDRSDEIIGGVLKWNEHDDEKYYGWHEKYLQKEVHGKSLDKIPQLYANVVAWNKLIRCDFINKHRIRFNKNIIKHEDNPFSCMVHILADRISIIPIVTYIYRQANTDSLMATEKKEDAFYRCKYCYDIFKFIESCKRHQYYRKMYYHRYSWQLIKGAEILSRFSPSKSEIYKLMKEWKKVIELLPAELPNIADSHRKIYLNLKKKDFDSAWRSALNFTKASIKNESKVYQKFERNSPENIKELKRLKKINRRLKSQIELVYSSRSWSYTEYIRIILLKIRGY